MDIAFGHTNTDFDCLASLVLVKKLYPGYCLVRSNQIHPAARNLYEFYEDCFDFIGSRDLEGQTIDNIIIVDTCMADRVKEYFNCIRNSRPAIRVFDHHPVAGSDIFGAVITSGAAGANATLLGKLAMEQGVTLSAEEATIVMTGIYADTGRLIFENVSCEDFEVAAWLLDMGASLKLVKSFLETVREDELVSVMNRVFLAKTEEIIQGHSVLLSFIELDENISGLSAVVDKVMEIENPDAYFAVFDIRKTRKTLLIARSRNERIDLHNLLYEYGGGGHQSAASAKLSGVDGPAFFGEFKTCLEKSLAPAVCAAEIMTRDVVAVSENSSLLEASKLMEEINHSGLPVIGSEDDITGFIGLKDIMKGRKAGVMNAPVSAYMMKPPVTAQSTVTLREVERIFYRYHIGHLPILEGRRLCGIVTRNDYLRFRQSGNQ